MRNSLRQKNNRWDLIGMLLPLITSGLLVLGLWLRFMWGLISF